VRFLIAGAGAVGGYLAARMARAGLDVTVLARGAHAAAIRDRGLRVLSPEGDFQGHPRVTDSPEAAGPADAVFLAVKAYSLPALAPRLAPLLSPGTVMVGMQNGVPWWHGPPLESVDPGGVIAAAIPAERVIGSIVYFSTELVEPGLIRHVSGNRLSLGEPDGARSERCRRISAALVRAGLRAPVTAHLRQEIWVKILGNAAFNPISALTGATLARMTSDPEVSSLVRAIMAEVACVAARLGLDLPVSIEQRIAGAAQVGEHKTSMLQDLEAGRPLELEAIVGAVLELGARLEVPMPHTRAVYCCTRLLAAVRRGAVAG
jgi:2-dehydropantoate 2-reductase